MIFVVDRSGSIGPANFQRELDFVKMIISEMNFDNHRVGFVSFANTDTVHFNVSYKLYSVYFKRLFDLKTKDNILNTFRPT